MRRLILRSIGRRDNVGVSQEGHLVASLFLVEAPLPHGEGRAVVPIELQCPMDFAQCGPRHAGEGRDPAGA
jgi:hypothetical protein